jgi:hypothetical protein
MASLARARVLAVMRVASGRRRALALHPRDPRSDSLRYTDRTQAYETASQLRYYVRLFNIDVERSRKIVREEYDRHREWIGKRRRVMHEARERRKVEA